MRQDGNLRESFHSKFNFRVENPFKFNKKRSSKENLKVFRLNMQDFYKQVGPMII